jgi:hypothetical protein
MWTEQGETTLKAPPSSGLSKTKFRRRQTSGVEWLKRSSEQYFTREQHRSYWISTCGGWIKNDFGG